MTSLFPAADRLREWSNDDLHALRSVRFHEPVYANPAALRADVRYLLAQYESLLSNYEALHKEAYGD